MLVMQSDRRPVQRGDAAALLSSYETHWVGVKHLSMQQLSLLLFRTRCLMDRRPKPNNLD